VHLGEKELGRPHVQATVSGHATTTERLFLITDTLEVTTHEVHL
jgi:hypothetical protein